MTSLLEDILKQTASTSSSKPYSVRIVWVTSLLQIGTPAGAMVLDDQGAPKVLPKPMENYMQSKVGETWLGGEFARRLDSNGILSVVSTE